MHFVKKWKLPLNNPKICNGPIELSWESPSSMNGFNAQVPLSSKAGCSVTSLLWLLSSYIRSNCSVAIQMDYSFPLKNLYVWAITFGFGTYRSVTQWRLSRAYANI